MMPQRWNIPIPVMERLAKYYLLAREKREEAVSWLSSGDIAKALGLTGSTVRQDLSYLDFSGCAKIGYELRRLEQALRAKLGADRIANVAIVGAGNLGKALSRHRSFARDGFAIRAVLDNDPSQVGRKIGDLAVSPIRNLARLVRRHRIDIGVLAVPEAAAQKVADALIRTGVKGLLNLTERHIQAPEGVHVLDVRIVASLLALLCQMQTGIRQRKGKEKGTRIIE